MISIIERIIEIDGKTIYKAPEKLSIMHIFNDKILLLYDPHPLIPASTAYRRDIPVKDSRSLDEVNRNALAIDFKGNVLWRIESDADHYNPWTVLTPETRKADKWIASTQDGYQYDIDIQTGTLSNGILMK